MHRSGERFGALLVPRGAPAPVLAALERRIVPALETLMAAALDREALVREVVESAAVRRSDELKTAILRAVSHDLRSPLTAMVAAGEALGSSALPEEDRRELAAAIASEGARLTRLIEKLLDLSRLEAGTAEPRRDWTSIEEVIRAAVDAVGAGPDRVSLVLAQDLPLIDADAAQLERAFANLLENALRHSDGFPVSVRARVSGGRLLVRIVDRGPGIPLAEQERIFEPFYRAPGARDVGSGLGLAIVKGFIEGNGGRVHVESLPEQGTSFVVVAAAAARARAPAARAGGGERVSSARRILVCDDEPQILRALKVVLREAGFEAIPAETGEEALDRAAVRPPDAAIVDLVLPDIDGIEVCRRLREWSDMPILVLSAVGEEEEKVRALEAGADDYVTKPFGARELVARLQAALRRAGGGPDEPAIRVDGLEVDLVGAHGARQRLGGPPDADRVRPAAHARPQPRAADDPPRAAGRGLGPAVRVRHADPAHAHRQPAAQDRAGGRGPALHPHRPRRRLPARPLSSACREDRVWPRAS